MTKSKKSQLRVALNGFGRIGRRIFRQGFDSLNIVLVNGTSSPSAMAHLLQYDSIYGQWDPMVSVKGQDLIVKGRPVSCLQEKNPSLINWGDYQVDVVLECSGKFKKSSDWQKAFSKGVKKVVVSTVMEDPDFTLVYGVNQGEYQKEQNHFISSASCTSNCLAPIIKVLKESCGVRRVFFSTIHSYTRDQNLLDSSHKKDWRRARSAGLNIIPTSTGASQALSSIFPELKNSFQGMAFRVPTANVSLLDLTIEIKKSFSLDEIHQAFRKSASTDLKGILAVEELPLVSSDFIGRRESAIIDFPLSFLQGKALRLVSWYDNEAGFSERMIDFVHYMDSQAC